MVLDPLGGIDPAILRLEGLVGHFSTYSFVAVTPVPEPASGMLPLAASVVFTLRVKKSSVVCSLREQRPSRGA